MVDMSLHIFVLIKQTIHSYLVIQPAIAQAARSPQQIGKGKIDQEISTKILQRLCSVINAGTKASFSLQKPLHWAIERPSSMAKLHAAQAKCVYALWLHRVTGAGAALPRRSLAPCQSAGAGLSSKAKDSPQCLRSDTLPGAIPYCWGGGESPVNSNNKARS